MPCRRPYFNPRRSRAASALTAASAGRLAELMAELDDIATAIEEIAAGVYGMSGPGTVSGDAGDEMAQDLELQTQRLTDLHQKMENYFIAITG